MIDTHSIFNIKNQTEFKDLALNIFKYQFENNRVYRSFCDLLYKHPSEVNTLKDIPFIPIQFFKTRDVLSSTIKLKQLLQVLELQEAKPVSTMLPI